MILRININPNRRLIKINNIDQIKVVDYDGLARPPEQFATDRSKETNLRTD